MPWRDFGVWILAFAVGGSLVLLARTALPGDSGSMDSPSASIEHLAAEGGGHGTRLVMVYIGKGDCPWSTLDWMPGAVKEARRLLTSRADSLDVSFADLGIALDASQAAGLRHLEKAGRFHAAAVGRWWTNAGAQRYVWGDVPGPPATPQIVVTLQRFHVDGSPDGLIFEVVDEFVLARKVGTKEIAQWVDAGAPIPSEEVSARANEASLAR